jgi:hypothetical protein
LFSHGEMPDEANGKTLKLIMLMIMQWLEDGLDEDDLDMFEGDDSFEDWVWRELELDCKK